MKGERFLYCYKMTHDTGFAPNPYQGVLTLATCKPTIRRCAEIGYWISGWTSNKVQGKKQKYTFSDYGQKLIYLAKVSDKMLIKDYWEKYPEKRPSPNDWVNDFGDNIYEPLGNDDFHQHNNGGGHNSTNIKRDLSGKYVLICNEFYYFGVENAIPINVEKGFVVHRLNKLSLENNSAKKIIDQVINNYKPGIVYPLS